jgi:hypothetical protein
MSSKIGHGGGGVILNADGPSPLGRWRERSEIWIRSGIALGVVDRSDGWRRYGYFKLIRNLGSTSTGHVHLGAKGQAGHLWARTDA